MLSKTISTSKKVNRLPDRAALLYTWLLPHTDEFGHLEGETIMVKGKIVPMRSVTVQEVQEDLDLMVQNELIRFYEVGKEKYIEIINFDNFQTFRKDRDRKGDYPGPDGKVPVVYRRDTNGIPEVDQRQLKGSEENRREGKVREGEEKPTASMKYLSNIPDEDMRAFLNRFVATEKALRSKAESLKLYCESKNRRYTNYKSFLLNALKKDFKERDGATVAGGKFQGL
ncbi:MAG: hypothetical protein WC763_04605 [Candidatus Paceibacterota bacterium]|jgi:hypothetical protein